MRFGCAGLSITNSPFWHLFTYQVEKGESEHGWGKFVYILLTHTSTRVPAVEFSNMFIFSESNNASAPAANTDGCERAMIGPKLDTRN